MQSPAARASLVLVCVNNTGVPTVNAANVYASVDCFAALVAPAETVSDPTGDVPVSSGRKDAPRMVNFLDGRATQRVNDASSVPILWVTVLMLRPYISE